VSEVDQAKSQAKTAAIEARKAQGDALEALLLAHSLEKKLWQSNRRNDSLLKQTQEAREKAHFALLAAETAQKNAETSRLELAIKTESLEKEAAAMKENYEKIQLDSEELFASAMDEQRSSAVFRESVLIGVTVLLLLGITIVVLWRRKKTSPVSVEPAPVLSDEVSEPKNNIELHMRRVMNLCLTVEMMMGFFICCVYPATRYWI